MTTSSRISYKVAPQVFKALLAFDASVNETGLEKSLIDLIKIRASQINGCFYCIDMHTREARARGETEQRIYLLQSWKEVPLYSERERAAMAWTEAVTLVADTNVPDDVYEFAHKHFSDVELVELTLVITVINMWNRFAISFDLQIPQAKVAP
ncbi:MAG: carboxymuconolactone decarboxylase family protein [Gemmatimonadaceae bacterium]